MLKEATTEVEVQGYAEIKQRLKYCHRLAGKFTRTYQTLKIFLDYSPAVLLQCYQMRTF
jgi:hypothetical protein